MRLFSRLFPLILVIALSYWAVRPLFVSGFFSMHDDTQVSRVFEMAKALSFGQFPVRWIPDLGYGFGYPLFNFYAPLPYYIGAFFHLVGFDVIWATKLMFIFGIILTGFTMYFLGKELAGIHAGISLSVLYQYAPYHAVNIYVRGAVGEFYAFAFLPLIILGIVKIIRYSYSSSDPDVTSGESRSIIGKFSTRQLTGSNNIRQGIVLGAIGLAGVLLSHNILGMITGFFLVVGLLMYLIYLLFSKYKLNTLYLILYAIILGFGLSAFFILPAIGEKNYTKAETLVTGGSDFKMHFVYPDQLWNSPWGFAGSASGREDGMSFKIGKIHLLLGLLSIPLALYLYKIKHLNNVHSLILNSCFLILIFSVFLMLEQSKLLWETIPGFAYIQYPWRFLNFTILGLTVLSIFLFVIFPNRLFQFFLMIGIVSVVFWFNLKYFLPQDYISVQPEDYISDTVLRYKISKISDEYLPKGFPPPEGIEQIAWVGVTGNPQVTVNTFTETPTRKEYSLSVVKEGELVTNIAFFPGWSAKLDGKNVKVTDKNGRIQLRLSKGNHQLQLNLGNTPIRTLANSISFLSIFLLVYVSLKWRRNIR